eukprot:CAMPEP_0206425680 /NCGR_PEP_ID=MMETSP0324_2-20121206/3934_1 /ASSEMBLY_ACC=CAM_ASM_000836 /TAXON_ID=2866 /ORGANISM="Crypthecodinium cohnii, Strain Seligo" /LENGTH=76 /DNA_ID=CAMNT_0053890505 /DNA_START=828 /DNA_END=1058 /DNA_ORIENTATION=-
MSDGVVRVNTQPRPGTRAAYQLDCRGLWASAERSFGSMESLGEAPVGDLLDIQREDRAGTEGSRESHREETGLTSH